MSEILTLPPPARRAASRHRAFSAWHTCCGPGQAMDHRHAIKAAGIDQAVLRRHQEVRNAAWVVIAASILIIVLVT